MTSSRYYSGKRDIKEVLAAYPGGSVDLSKDDAKGIAKILINNPEKKNAFSGKLNLRVEYTWRSIKREIDCFFIK